MDPPEATTITAAIPKQQTASSPSSSAKGPQQPQSKPLSCTSCRARKLKCDRQHPCRNCTRSGLPECIFPERKRSRRPRKSKNSDLLQRLHRLESIVGKVGLLGQDGSLSLQLDTGTTVAQPYKEASDLLDSLARGAQKEAATIPGHQYPLPGEGTASASPPGIPSSEGSRQGGHHQTRQQDSTVSRYLSGDFWASLCEEVGGLRQALEKSIDSDAEEDDGYLDQEGTTPESTGTGKSPSYTPPGTALLLGPSLGGSHTPLRHPSPEHIRFLTATYFQNVDMLLKILHRPTITAALHAFADQQQPLSPEREALFFAIYYAAVTSLPTEKCAAHLGSSRSELAQAYREGIEHALARADYLNSSSLETLQALTLYTSCLRSHDGSRASWALLSLPIRLAQALDLHRDGAGDDDDDDNDDNDEEQPGKEQPRILRRRRRRRFTPFEAEQRRRLWWQLIVLDIRAAEDRGTRGIIARDSYNTRLPHNVDDADFGPETAVPLSRLEKPAGAPSDVTFSLCTAESSGIFLYFEHAQNVVDSCSGRLASSSPCAAAEGQGSGSSGNSYPTDEATVVRLARHLETRFVHGADPSHAASYLASTTVRLIILKLWLMMRYPLHQRPPRAMACSSMPKPHAHAAPSSPPITTAATTSTAPRPPPASVSLSRESTLRTATTIMELSERGRSGPFGENFRWWSELYVQWHPLAVALAELCTLHQSQSQPQSHLPSHPQLRSQQQKQTKLLTDKAWALIDAVFPKWSEVIADTKRGTLWRPIRALYRKAREARMAAEGVHSTTSTTTTTTTAGAITPSHPSLPKETPSSSSSSSSQNQNPEPDPVKQEHTRSQPQQPFYRQPSSRPPGSLDTATMGLDLDLPTNLAISTSTSTSTATATDTDIPMDLGMRSGIGDITASSALTSDGYDPSNMPPDLGGLSLDMHMNGMSQEWMGWPDVSFDMPPSDSADWGAAMDWSTWDQFVLDTFADTQSKSGSSEPA
ncbi:fungal-specific transcription factor domain-containing protein [Camillea tinctor]|nr:fungal-specific transcription factor domain-containing protein [Camillea tinctor]